MNIIIKDSDATAVKMAFAPCLVHEIDPHTCSLPSSWCREELVWLLGTPARRLLEQGIAGTVTLEGILSHQSAACPVGENHEPDDYDIDFLGVSPEIDKWMLNLFNLCCHLINAGLGGTSSLYDRDMLYLDTNKLPPSNKIRLEVNFPGASTDFKFGSITGIPLEWCARHYILSLLVEIPRIWLRTATCQLDLRYLFNCNVVNRRLPSMHLEFAFRNLMSQYLPLLLFTGGTWQFWNILGMLCNCSNRTLPEDYESSGYRSFLHNKYKYTTEQDTNKLLYDAFSTKGVLAFSRLSYFNKDAN